MSAANIPTLDFSSDDCWEFDYLGHECMLVLEIDGDGPPNTPYLSCDGFEVIVVEKLGEDAQGEHDWDMLLMATHDREFNTPEVKAVLARVLDRHIAKVEAARSAGNGWNDHFGAGPHQGVLDNGDALRAVMTPEQLAALKNGGAS